MLLFPVPSPPQINSSTGETISLETRDPVTSYIGKNITVLNFVTVKLRCETSGAPLPTVTWYKDGRKLEADSSAELSITDGDLVDGGKYTCTATNIQGVVSVDSFIRFVGTFFLYQMLCRLLKGNFFRLSVT